MRARTLIALVGLVGCARPQNQAAEPASTGRTTSSTTDTVRADAPATVPLSPQDPPLGNPDAIVDLGSREGAALVKAQWRWSEAKIVEIDGKGPGADLKPSGAPLRTYDVTPKAGVAEFDDAKWETVDPTQLDRRRGGGRVSFGWYRTSVTIPDRVGAFDTAGSVAALEIVIDDYAEIWIDGKLPRELGRPGGPFVKGFNAPNRVVVGRDLRPGQKIQLAIFGMNGPISASPENFIWIKSATLDFHRAVTTPDRRPSLGALDRRDPALDAVFPEGARVEKLAAGFQFTEGPVWSRAEGTLFFSDPNANTIYRYWPDGQLAVFRPKSGYKGVDVARYHQPGSNGLAFDRDGRLTICEHGNRRVTRLEKNGQLTVLADSFEGKRLNSPNDLVYKSDGALYFTDPPFGLPKAFDDANKELAYSGVFRVKDGRVDLVAKDVTGPNGIAFSPDESSLYVTNWDEKKKVVMRYPVRADGLVGPGAPFFDMTTAPGEEALDGLKIDAKGNLFVSGPGGVWIVSPEGKHIGTLRVAELPANLAWGDDGKTLYMTARTGLYRVRTATGEVRP